MEFGLKSFGNEWNFEVIEKAISSHEQWYKGDGVYGDGENFHLDYYNSYVIHPMLLQVLKVVVKYDSSYQTKDKEALRDLWETARTQISLAQKRLCVELGNLLDAA